EYGYLSGRMDADFARFEEARARSERSGDVRRRDAAGLDVAGIAQPAELPASRRIGLSSLESGDVGNSQRFGERRLVVSGVVQERDRGLIREGLDEIASADLGRAHLHFACSGLDQPLDDVRSLGPPRAAISVHRRGVREY